MLTVPTAGGHERVQFVHEDDARRVVPGEVEEDPNELLAFASPFGDQGARTDIEKSGAAFGRYGLCQHGFSRAGRAVEKDALPGRENACKQFRVSVTWQKK